MGEEVVTRGGRKPAAKTSWEKPPEYEEEGRTIERGGRLPLRKSWMTDTSATSDPYPIAKGKTPIEPFQYTEAEKGPTFFNLFCQRVEVAGLNKVSDPEYGYFRRFLWLAVILGALAFGIFQCSTQISQFFNRPIRIKVNVTRVKDLEFPVLTFCNFNFWKKSPSDKAGITSLVWLIANEQEGVDMTPYAPMFKGFSWEKMYKEYAHTKKDTIFMCSWKQKTCSLEQFKELITDMGYCFQFNSDNPYLTVDNAGTDYALQLHLIVDVDEYLAGKHGPGAGFQILAHSPFQVPLLRSAGVAVAPGMHTFIGLKKRVVEKLSPPHGTCGSKTLKYYSQYSTSACLTECSTDYMVEHCDCKIDYQPGNHSVCNPMDLYDCGFERFRMFVHDPNQTCTDTCPDECRTIYYDTDVSAVPIHPAYYYKLVQSMKLDPGNYTFLPKNLAIVNIYLSDMNIEETVQQPAYTPIDMFCDVGGSFGLVLGASILTIIDIFDFLIYYFITRKIPTKVTVIKP